LKAAAAAGAGAGGLVASAVPAVAAEPGAAESSVPTVTLGRTGKKVTILGMGTSWALSPSFVQAALFSGVRYIDTSETYENTRAEKVLGDVLDRTKMRKDVYLVTKNTAYRRNMGTGVAQMFERRLNASLERLKTDYLDCYYLHGLAGNQAEARIARSGDEVEAAAVHQGDHLVRGSGDFDVDLAAGRLFEVGDPVIGLVGLAALDVAGPGDDIDLALALADRSHHVGVRRSVNMNATDAAVAILRLLPIVPSPSSA